LASYLAALRPGGYDHRPVGDGFAPGSDPLAALVAYLANACWSLANDPSLPMDKLLFWLGIGAAQKSAGSKPPVQRNWVMSLVIGALVAAVMIVGMFLLLVSQKL
jgi:hypothetical protein